MPFDVHRFPVLGEDSYATSNFTKNINNAFRPIAKAQPSIFDPESEFNIKSSEMVAEAAKKDKWERRLKEGMDAGRNEGEILAREEIAPELQKFKNMRLQLSNQIQQLVQTTANQTIAVALAMVKSILCKDMLLHQDLFASLLPDLQGSLSHSYHATLRLPTSELDLLREIVEVAEFLNLDTLSEVSIVADPSLGSGQMQVEHQRLDTLALTEQINLNLTTLLENSLINEM